jgi:hypothetical protein
LAQRRNLEAPLRAGNEVCLIFTTPDNAPARLSGLGASRQWGQVWVRRRFPNFFILPGRLRSQAKSRQVLGRTSEPEKASHFKT